ncbi:DUF1752-domain-containing protein [Hypoxylon fragiforme]|uniref:DUF1752-domain-containing protein n=1 Tax=Hypoxylon fragiforme TaxID=63214 RepID=UPI0020C5D4C1|nr:DUF1752-domain-containing protein [Hypoxylon fragiforme]KAI2610124.1 DUF1752-domain-containing protein [Hypoxylon fragiforme]
MPCKAEGLVLTVDPNVIHKVDTNNPQNLFSMWTVFSRCADSVEQGRRLENLSWRLWNRETFCCEAKGLSAAATTLPKDIPEHQRLPEVPQLSGSVDSVADEEAIDFTTISDPVEIVRPRIVRQDSCASSRSRGRERHITSDHLEKMVVSIIQEKEPNLAPLPDMSSPSVESSDADQTQSSYPEAEQTPQTPVSEAACELTASYQSSTQSKSQEAPATTVIRGFSPSHIPSFRVSHEPKITVQDPIPDPQSSPAPKPVQSKKQPPKFKLGDSSSNESSPQSMETRQPMPPPSKRPMFEVGVGSSGDDESPSLKSAMHSSRPGSLLSAQKKQTSFNNQVTTRTIQTPSDQSDSYMDESAIDDDDEDSEWEDSIEESGKSSVDDAVTFKRVPSKANLTSQRSLISLMFAGQEERVKGLSNYASHSTPAIPQRARNLQSHSNMNIVSSPNDSDTGLEMRRGLRPTPLKPITEIPRSSAQPIMTNPQTHHHQAALSPRTTRRNMLATELTESLRRQLLWERQQKTSTANAVLKRRHTSLDVANLKQYPEKAYMGKAKAKDEPNSSSWNQYFSREDFGGYHAQGW